MENEELILQEADRAKLDNIVSDMVNNGESDADIEFVVSDFKQKYGKSQVAEEVTPDVVKKKETTESPSPVVGGSSVLGGSENKETIPLTPIQEVPDQEVNNPIAELYKKYKEEGKIRPDQTKAIEEKLKAQEEGDRGFWETANAMTEGFLKTGAFVPLFQYDSKEELVAAAEQKNKINFLAELPEDTLAELKDYAGKKISELEGSNLNTLAENKMLEERGKDLVNQLKYHARAIDQLKESGQPIPLEGATKYKELYNELTSLQSTYNRNIDIIENNTEDVGDFYEEINLLKKNYGGLDYYSDMARLTGASMLVGIGEFAVSTDEVLQDKVGVNLLTLTDDEGKAKLNKDFEEFRKEIANQQEYQRPAMSVNDIEDMESFGSWVAEQVATQLPVLTTLAATGGTAGLGILGASAAGQRVAELEDARKEAQSNIDTLNTVLETQSLSEDEVIEIEKSIAEQERAASLSDDEMYLAGLGVGALEVVTERVSLGILSKGKRAFMAAKKSPKFKDFTKGIGKGAVSGGQEGGAEFINQFGSNLIDVLYLNDPDTHIFDGTLDALASGAAMGIGMKVAPSAVGMGAKAFMPKEKTAEIKKKSQKIADLLGEIEVNAEVLDPNAKKVLKNKANKLKKEVAKDLKEVFDTTSKRGKELNKELIDLDKKANKISKNAESIRKSNISKENKQELLEDLQTELDKVSERKNEILNTKIEDGTKQEGNDGQQEIVEGEVEGRTETGKGEAQEGADPSVSTDVERPSIDLATRTIRIVNPFTQSKPFAEIPLGETLDGTIDRVTENFVDRFFPIKKVQSAIEKSLGKVLPKSQNFRKAEILMHGKAANKMMDFAKDAETLIKDTANSDLIAKEGKGKVDRLSDYLMARHAQERNAHIRKLPLKDEGQEVNEAGSGMTDAEAQKILDSFQGKEKEAVERLAERVDNILEETRQIMLEGGLITELQKDVLTNYYNNYVPLQGWDSDQLESDMMSAFGLSLSVKGKEMKRAAGRSSKADNVLANVIGFRNNMIIRAEKNKVMQTLYNMAKENPDSKIWKTYDKKRPDVVKGLTPSGKVGDQVANMAMGKEYVGVKFNGEQKYIKFANERLADAINSASIEKANVINKTLGKFNRYLSSVLTTYNPEFMISNAVRDIQTAIINQASETDISNNTLKDKTFIRQTIKSTVPSIKAIYRSEKGKPENTEIDKYYREFKEDGAKTEWFYAQNVEGIKKDIQKIVNRQKGGGKNAAKNVVKSVQNLLDNSNTAVENGVRLAAYMEARKAGVERSDAAEFAKELTINFNQKGRYGTVANSLMLFFNASVQGTVRFSKAMATLKRTVDEDGNVKYGLNRAQKIAAGLAAASAVNTLINMSVSGDDEDGVSFYKKIPDFEKERNFIIMNPFSEDGEYFKIPLPYGYNIFHNMGTIAAEVSMGEREVGDGAGFMVNSMLGAFSPLNFSSSKDLSTKLAKTVSPTFLKPVVEIVANESHFGTSIYNENFPVGTPKPESQLARPSTNQDLVAITQFINEVTGGSEFRSGVVDINADKVEHMLEFLGGGTLKFLNNTWKGGKYLVETAQGKETEIQSREIPVLRKVYGEPSEFINTEVYYDRKIEIDQLYDEYKSDVKNNKGEELYRGVVQLKKLQKAYDKRLKALRGLKRKHQDIQDPVKRSKKIKEVEDKIESTINKFNKKYNELRGE